jgi:Na+/melibiose symporter-like transporter
LTMQLGATGTIALVAAFAPAIIAWQLDVAAYNERSPKQEGGAAVAMDINLVFAPMSLITSIVAVFAPLLASPFANALQSILGAVGGKLG